MAKGIRVRGVRRKQVDEDKLALAFLLLAKILHEQQPGTEPGEADDAYPSELRRDEAA
jgi:hypothetical protein